jgi:hypothetical protein
MDKLGWSTRAVNQVKRFMIFDMKYDMNCEDEEYNKWLTCKFFDDKLYNTEAFAKRRGVGVSTLQYVRNIGKELQKSV